VSHALIVGQVAVAVIVVAGAGLCLRSVLQLTRVEPGFDVERRLGVATILPRATYEQPAATTAFYARACERLRALPGVQSVALTSTIPIGGGGRSYAVQFEGRPTDRGVSALYYLVGPDYFSVMGIPVLRGRSFADTDRDGAPRVAIVNDEFVRVHYPNEDPIGKRIRMGRDGDVVREIVGVVGGVKHYGLRDAPEAQMYEPFQQSPITDMNFVLKTATDPSGLIAAVRGAIQSVDPDQPVARAEALESMLARSTMLSRVQTALLSGLAGIAVSLAAIGLYGVLAYTVAQRRREIGIRIALGAQAGSVMHLISGQAMRVTGAGLVIGAIGWALLARTLSRTLEPMLFQVTLFDLSTLAVVFLILIVVTVAAAVVPARRAIHTDPIDVLRIG
jgi:predicted permease